MGISDRPYVGNWQINRTLVRHTPDAIVYVNGHAELSVCASCNKKLDLNKYITSVSCNAGVEPNASATISMSVPKMSSDVFSHDGNYVLRPGLEVVIFMRGYFPMEGYALLGQDSGENDTPVYPYYQVFRGVVTSVSHEFSGGFYSASISCANMLNFWSNQYLSTNGAVFGPRPDGSGVSPNLTGHTFTGSTPYSIIYTLMRTGFGAAYSVGWSVSQRTNVNAETDASGESLYHHAAEWWEKRWQSSSMKLRMYGFDGSLFNFLEQAYVGMFGSEASDRKFIKSYNTLPDGTTSNFDMEKGRQKTARAIGYSGAETTAAFMDAKGYRLDALKMQAFTYDMGSIANVNFFESEYMSKMEIAEAVTGITGFEFYQDVDGDLVFKPPFYNMDTSEDPVYVIEDRDLISISETENEPEATYVKGTGGLFGNTTGVLSGEFGTKQAMFIDWRLVAKFGWKETSFESHYLNNASQLYVSAISRLDEANAGSKSADITIPIRPEIRPGYPVYVRSLDCFFYVRDVSHSFSPGGECTTTLTCIAKRPKFLPPGLPDRSEGEGSKPIPTMKDVKLSGAGSYPPMPLYVYPEDVEGSDGGQPSGPPRIMGFPNCVMALDPTKVNTDFIGDGSLVFSQPDSAFEFALSQGILHRDPDNPDQYRLENGDGTYESVSKSGFLSTWESAYTFLQAYNENPSTQNYERLLGVSNGSDTLASALITVTSKFYGSVEDPSGLKNWVFIQKSLKSVYGYPAVTGTYRYFSSSAEEASDQSPSEISFKDSEPGIKLAQIGPPPGDTSLTVLRQENDRIKVKSGKPDRAFRVYGFTGQDQADYKDTTTDKIRFATFQRVKYTKTVDLVVLGETFLSQIMVDKEAFKSAVGRTLTTYARAVSPDENASTRLGKNGFGYDSIYSAIREYELSLEVNASSRRDTASSLSKALGGLYTKSYTKKVKKAVTNPDGNGTTVKNVPERVPSRKKYGDRDPESNTAIATRYSITRNKSDRKALGAIIDDASRALASYMSEVQNEFKKRIEESGSEVPQDKVEPITSKRNEVLSVLDGFDSTFPETPTAHSSVEKEVGVPTLVLPVSDNSGYEVYGGLAYGRGITVDKQYKLLATEGRSIDANSAEAIEAFVSGLIGTGADVPGTLGVLSDERKAVLASNFGLSGNISDEQIVEALGVLNQESKSGSAFIRNNPITSKSRGMSYTQELGIKELANLTVGEENTVCVCKGVEASHFLQAFTGKYVQVGEDSVGEFLRDEALVSGESWKVTRDAVSGKSVNSGAINQRGLSSYQSITERTNQAGQGITEAFQTDVFDEEG